MRSSAIAWETGKPSSGLWPAQPGRHLHLQEDLGSLRHSVRTCFLHGSPSRMGEVHQDPWEAQSPAHRAMSQILTQHEAAGVGGGSEELQGPLDLPASRGEEVCVVQASLGKNRNAKTEKCLPTAQPCRLYLEATCCTASWHNCTHPAFPRPLRSGYFITFSTQQVDSSHLTSTWSPSPIKF